VDALSRELSREGEIARRRELEEQSLRDTAAGQSEGGRGAEGEQGGKEEEEDAAEEEAAAAAGGGERQQRAAMLPPAVAEMSQNITSTDAFWSGRWWR